MREYVAVDIAVNSDFTLRAEVAGDLQIAADERMRRVLWRCPPTSDNRFVPRSDFENILP